MKTYIYQFLEGEDLLWCITTPDPLKHKKKDIINLSIVNLGEYQIIDIETHAVDDSCDMCGSEKLYKVILKERKNK